MCSANGIDARSACLRNVSSIGVAPDGNICLATQLRIFKIDSNGIINVFAGAGVNSFSGDGGPAREAGIGASVRKRCYRPLSSKPWSVRFGPFNLT